MQNSSHLLKRERLGAAAQSVVEAFDQDLRRSLFAIQSTRQLISAYPQLSRKTFLSNIEQLGENTELLRFLEWQPRVPAAKLQQFEQDVQKSGLANFRLTEPSGTQFIPVKPREEYVPVLYAWPESSAAIGVDMNFDPGRMESKHKARDSGLPIASDPFNLISDGKFAEASNAFAISVAVYREANPVGVTGRRQALLGYLAGVIEIPTLLNEAAVRADNTELELSVYALNGTGRKLLFSTPGFATNSQELVQNSPSEDLSLTLEVAGTPWELVLSPRPAFFDTDTPLKSRLALGSGLLVTLMLGAGLLHLQRTRRRIEAAHAEAAQARQALATERGHLLNVLEGTSAGTWEWHLQTNEVRLNERWADMLGYTLAELAPINIDTWQKLLHPEDLKTAHSILQQHISGQRPDYALDFRMRHKAGHWVWVSAHGRLISHSAEGLPEWIAGTHIEITEQKNAGQILLDLKQALDTHAIVCTTDLNGKILYVNNKFCEISQFSRDELLGQTNRLVSSGHHAPPFYAQMWQTISAGTAWRGQLCNKAKDGHLYWVDSTIAPIRSADGKPEQFIAILYDITEAKLYEEKLVEARNAAELANQAKSLFLANMSHEIRTPMNAIMGLTQLVLNTELPAQAKDYLNKVYGSSKALLGILNDILDYSKIEAGQLDINPIPMRLETVLGDAAALFATELEQKKLRLSIELTPEIPETLLGDPLRIGQILNNLLGNAIKFTDKGDIHIAADVAGHSQGEIEIRFTIQDTGIGMSADKAKHIFKAFTQADSTITRRFGGTGLGLSICQKLVAMMGGDISVTSREGEGSIFTFNARFGQLRSPALSPEAKRLVGRKILLAVPKPETLQSLSGHLHAWGIELTTTKNSAECLKQIQLAQSSARPFEALILDAALPELNATQLLIGANSTASRPSIKSTTMILLASNDELPAEKWPRETAILMKPCLPGALRELLIQNLCAPTLRTSSLLQQNASATNTPKLYPHARILLAEDNQINQMVACGMLEIHGIKPVVVGHGGEALERLKTEDFDLVFMDQHMPVMDGCEATRQIRLLPHCAALPIVAMTAAVMEDDRYRCMAAGMQDFVAKPIEPADLARVLAQWLKNPQETSKASPTPMLPVAQASPAIALASTPALPALPGFDLPAALARVGGNQALLHSLLHNLYAQARVVETRLDELAAQPEDGALHQALHSLKGSAMNLGANKLGEAAAHYEQAATQADSSTAGVRFKEHLRETLQALETLFAPKALPRPGIRSKDWPALSRLLRAIEPYLKEHELVPGQLMAELETICLPEHEDPILKKLRQQLDCFDHDAALASIATLFAHQETGEPT